MKAKMRAPAKKAARRPTLKERVINPKSLLYNPQFEKLVSEDCLITLKCSICLEFYNDPTVLPCGHTFCCKCLLEMADHAKLNNRDPEPSDPYIGCPECRENVSLSSLTNKEITVNYPLQQIIDIMMKREEDSSGMIITKPNMVTASTSYHKADFEEEQRAMEEKAREEAMDTINRQMDGFERALAGGSSILNDAFLDIERIRGDHLDSVRKGEQAAARAKAEKKYGGKTQFDATDFPKMMPSATPGATVIVDPAIVSYAMFQQPPVYTDFMCRPAVPVQL